MSAKQNNGKSFELAVAAVQSRLDPGAKVSHDAKIPDRDGIQRQFDVVVRGNLGGYEILGVIECKDTKKRIGLPQVEAFFAKTLETNANLKVIVSRRGFSESAVEKAQKYGIETLSLLPDEGAAEGFMVGTISIADVFNWSQIALHPHYEESPPPTLAFEVDDVLYEGQKAIEWFTNELIKNYSAHEEEGDVCLRVPFEVPREFTISGNPHLLTAITFVATRIRQRKARRVGVTGDGFFDWQKNSIKAPPNSNLRLHDIPLNFFAWEDVDKDAHQDPKALDLRFTAHAKQLNWIPGAIDLEAL